MSFQEIRSKGTGKLLAEIDTGRRLLRFKYGRKFYFVDMDEYLEGKETANKDAELRQRLQRVEEQLKSIQRMQPAS